MFTKLATFVTFALFSTFSWAAELGAATISDQFLYPSYNALGVGHFTVTTAEDDAIVGLQSDCCKAVELHRTEKINGAMAMRRIAELNLKKGTAMAVQPEAKGGEHLMLIGLRQPLKVGDVVDITFTFKHAGDQTVRFTVKDRPVTGNASEHTGHAHE